jgi:hypothetical protein
MDKFMKLSYEEKVAMGQAARNKISLEFDRKKVVDAYLGQINK